MIRKKISILVILCIVPLILTSCWDIKEINERAFVNAIYIEKNTDKKPSGMIASKLYERDNEDLFITYGIANTGEGSSGSKAFTTSVTAISLGDGTEKLNSQTTKEPFYGHTKLIIFGKGILEDPKNFKQVLDSIERYTLIDRDIKVITAENSEVTLEKMRPQTENLYSSYVTGVMDASDSIAYTVSMTLGELLQSIREEDGKGMLPVVSIDEGNIKVDKVAFIEDYKLKDIAHSREVRGYKLFTAENSKIEEYIQLDNNLTSFKLSSVEREVKYIKGGNVPKFKIHYAFEGTVESYDFNEQIFSVKKQGKLQEKLKDMIEAQLRETVGYFQDKIGIDYLGLDDYTRKFHPSEYKKYKNWDKAFQNAQIDFDISINLVKFGDTK